ncbi:MAG: hypothetical protein JJE03_04615 [Peptostreptococcaceae bacterium]|nr:hypothetical protein [Peptostreptococcaceae bacterium]
MKNGVVESLVYSYLRQIKKCQVTQKDWVCSPNWEIKNRSEIIGLIDIINAGFPEFSNMNIFDNNSLDLLLAETEVGVMGISCEKKANTVYIVDAVFDEKGLKDGFTQKTVEEIIKKYVNCMACALAYWDGFEIKAIFASPKVNKSVYTALEDAVAELNKLLKNDNMPIECFLYCNEEFYDEILNPTENISGQLADSHEFFLKSIELYSLFDVNEEEQDDENIDKPAKKEKIHKENEYEKLDKYKHLRIGQLVRTVVPKILNSRTISDGDLLDYQDRDFCKELFDIQYPLLIKLENTHIQPARYYSKLYEIKGGMYYLCSEWYENKFKNDRIKLEAWIKENKK